MNIVAAIEIINLLSINGAHDFDGYAVLIFGTFFSPLSLSLDRLFSQISL